jgi:cation transporter-like permease
MMQVNISLAAHSRLSSVLCTWLYDDREYMSRVLHSSAVGSLNVSQHLYIYACARTWLVLVKRAGEMFSGFLGICMILYYCFL